MLRSAGIDIGHTQTRIISVGQFWGSAQKCQEVPASGAVIANVPSDRLTFRTMSVPSAGRDIQGRTIGEELAYSLPFSLEETSWDWIEKEENASVFVTMTSSVADIREKAGAKAALDAEPLSFLRACLEENLDEALVFDFGATKTTICAIKNKALEWIRVSFKGGDSLTSSIAAEREISLEEAEAIKIEQGMLEPQCGQWLDSIIKASLLPQPVPYNQIIITGGGSKMIGLKEMMSDLLGAPVSLFSLPEGLDPHTDAAAYGAALAAKPGRPRVRLCPQETQATPLKKAYIIWFIILLIAATADIEIRHASQARFLEQQEAVIAEAVEEQAPALAETNPSKIAEELNKQVEAAHQADLQSPEMLMKTLAGLAKPLRTLQGMEIRAFEYKSDNGTSILIKGQSDSAQQSEEFRSSLSDIIDDAELIENRASAQGRTSFSIEGKLHQE